MGDAAAEVRNNMVETGAESVDAARRLGSETVDRARSVTDKLSVKIAERALRRRGNDDSTVSQDDSPVGLDL